MPPRDLTKYSSYFTLKVPGSLTQIAIIVLLGMLAGSVSSVLVHYGSNTGIAIVILLGAGSGVLVVSVPALLTVMVIRIIKRKMKTKHALFAVLAVCAAYTVFIILDSAIYKILQNGTLAYIILLLANASIYGYWFIINRIAVGQRRSAILTAEIQPILNVLLYFPFGGYLLKADIPVGIALVKLYSGMLIFLVMGYAILYMLDRPAKKKLSVSSVDIFSNMIDSWLYGIAIDTTILGKGGVKRDVEVGIATLSSKGGIKAVFVNPDIHYGPFGTVGGSIFTAMLGNAIVSKFNSSPFIMHGAVNIEDNPMSTNQVHELANRVCAYTETLGRRGGNDAHGYVKFGNEGQCRAINIRINELSILTLSKAPYVTEDIDREVGARFAELASRGRSRTMLVDAHNSRFESAGAEELKGIGKGSRYIPMYEKAILKATENSRSRRLRFGSAHAKISSILHNPDLGPGYSSVGIFNFGKEKFGIIYIDANNMLPGFRGSMIEHIREKYGIDMEICTTDTHSVNSIAMSAKNALGRHTKSGDMLRVMDPMIERALNDTGPAVLQDGSITFKGFRVWGEGSEELLNKVGMDIINIGKRVVPFVIVAAYIFAGWIIYII
ncbi:MAG: DUF2070 family protein [Candidatus Micrarchaeaceae archaeon]